MSSKRRPASSSANHPRAIIRTMFYVRKRLSQKCSINSRKAQQVKFRRTLTLATLTYLTVLYSNLSNVRSGSIYRAKRARRGSSEQQGPGSESLLLAGSRHFGEARLCAPLSGYRQGRRRAVSHLRFRELARLGD